MKYLRLFTLITVLILIISPELSAVRKDKKKNHKTSEKVNIKPIKINLTPFLIGGFVVGEAADILQKKYDGNFSDKLLYGAGISLDYYPNSKHALGVNLEYIYKEVPNSNFKAIRAFSYSGSWSYYLRSLHKSRPFIKTELGIASIKIPDYFIDDTNLDLGRHVFFKLALGLFTYTGSFTNTRFEIYYKRLFTAGYKIRQLGLDKIRYDAEYIGIVFGVGIPL